jgi:hypothetical protein
MLLACQVPLKFGSGAFVLGTSSNLKEGEQNV